MSCPPALVSSPAALQHLPPWGPRRRRLVPRPACASRPSCDGLPRGSSPGYGTLPRLVAAQSHPPPPLAAGRAARRDAEMGLAFLLVVLAAVMSFFLSLTILSFSACRALHRLETAADKLAKVIAEEAPGTLSSLKLSFLEINDLTSQLQNLRKRLTISIFRKEASSKANSQTRWPKPENA